MTANSRLTKNQKAERRAHLHTLFHAYGDIASSGRYTVAKMPEFFGSKMARYSVSVCSKDEIKFRRKVGEYHALVRLFNWNECITLPNNITPFHLTSILDNSEHEI